MSAFSYLIAMRIIREYVGRLGVDSLQGFQERERWRGCYKQVFKTFAQYDQGSVLTRKETLIFTRNYLTEVTTLTEVFPCFFLSCKANARV